MWWARVLNRKSTPPANTLRLLERVISPSESHSAVPLRIQKAELPAQALEPVAGADYRIKKEVPTRLKQCF